MSLSGTVKSFNGSKGYGFVVGADGQEVFMHAKNCTDGMQPQQGDTLMYDLQPSKSKPGQMEACNISGGTAQKEGGGGGVTPVQGTGACDGQVRRFNPTKGFGFISYDGQDHFFHLSACVGTMPVEGDWVKFDMADPKNPGGPPSATNVTGGSAPLSKGDGKGKGKGKGGPYDAWGGGWGGDSWGGGGGGWGKGGDSWGGKGGWGGGDSWGFKGGKDKGGKGFKGGKDKGKGKGKW